MKHSQEGIDRDIWLYSLALTLMLLAIHLSSPFVTALAGVVLIGTSLSYRDNEEQGGPANGA